MNKDYLEIESSQRQHNETILFQEKMIGVSLKTDFTIFSMLNPTIQKEGLSWCVWYGNNWGTTNLIGFGKTIHEAIIDFNGSFYREIKELENGL